MYSIKFKKKIMSIAIRLPNMGFLSEIIGFESYFENVTVSKITRQKFLFIILVYDLFKIFRFV